MIAIGLGCRANRDVANRGERAGYLRADIDTSPLALDPRYGSDAITSRINELIFDSLARVDAHGRIAGVLAQQIDRPTPTELIFHLRPGVRFSDGRPLTAQATVIHRGRSLAVVRGEVSNAEGKLVALAGASAMILPGRRADLGDETGLA